MKRMLVLGLIVLFALSVFAGCTASAPTRTPEVLNSFPKDTAPSQMVKTSTGWVMLNSTYAGVDHTISAGENPDAVNTIYTVNDVDIWYFEANDRAVVWCEKTDGLLTFKIYTFQNETVETIGQIATEAGFQPQNVGIFLDTVYYCAIDYDRQTVCILAYNIESKTTAEFYTVGLSEELQPYSIHLDEEFLCFMCSDQVKVFDLKNNETVFDSLLPGDTKYVFSASYDSANDTCALYYADGNSEDIGIFKEEDSKISSVFTFSENHYAYRDKIECYDGHIYWIVQANVSGMVADHYRLVDYNYLEHKPTETLRAFDFCRGEDAVYTLCFNGGEYTHIDLGVLR